MQDFSDFLILKSASVREALERMNSRGLDVILFVVDNDLQLIGSLTDGDVRRGLLKGLGLEHTVDEFVHASPKVIVKGQYEIRDIIKLRENLYKVIPVVDQTNRILRVINFRYLKSYLPLDAVIMAGGRGSRLRPMTDTLPKPLLKVGDKPIMEHNVDRLRKFGVDDFWVSLRYRGEQIEAYFEDGRDKQVNIQYIWENEPLGTIGAINKVHNFKHDYILVTNSDLLTTLDYEDFFLNFIDQKADMSVATIPYSIDVPYAVMETVDNNVVSFKEKPTYTYYSNGGIYLIKKELLRMIPKDTFFNSTDLMEAVIERGMKLISYPVRGYWLDIGKPEDFTKAQTDIGHLEL